MKRDRSVAILAAGAGFVLAVSGSVLALFHETLIVSRLFVGVALATLAFGSLWAGRRVVFWIIIAMLVVSLGVIVEPYIRNLW
jgi:hypothetical protein